MQATLGWTVSQRLGLRPGLLTDALLVTAGSLLVALFAQIQIILPFTPVPITGQTFAVLLLGAALGGRRAAASLLLYLLEGAMGLPVFAGGSAGLLRLAGPTGGYLVGFLPAAYLVGLLAERGLDRRWYSALPVFLLGQLVLYTIGVIWLSTFVGLGQALIAGLWPFIVLDAAKAVLAAVALPSAWKLVGALPGSRPG
ncbi:MAG TPA: biotin transporter BioY [Anaerolineales bacterium]|jgi:biotin transport system substrate-specific component